MMYVFSSFFLQKNIKLYSILVLHFKDTMWPSTWSKTSLTFCKFKPCTS